MKTVLIAVVVVVLMAGSGGAGYYFGNANGFASAQNIRTDFFAQRTGGTGTGGQFANGTPQAQGTRGTGQSGQSGQGATLGRPTAAGVVKAVQGNNITVTQQDGTSATVTVDDKTQYEKLVSGTIADVAAGLRIVVTDVNGIKRIQLTPAQ